MSRGLAISAEGPGGHAPLVLASASPRRRALLLQVGIGARVEPSEVDERALEIGDPHRAPEPEAFALRAASAKADEVLRRLDPEQVFVLGADTIVVRDEAILGKPSDDREAARMLGSLADRWHQVKTALSLCARTPSGGGELARLIVTTSVRFAPLEPAQIAAYVATGEGRDKAGAYAAQGLAQGFISEIRGSYSNVVGLPLAETLALFRTHDVIGSWP
ncbi:MAG: Maf family protein [Myxococcales bacterium]|nr:Maf family protein [Myxococcales bacterium]